MQDRSRNLSILLILLPVFFLDACMWYHYKYTSKTTCFQRLHRVFRTETATSL
jgi:hypothetical protein